jgi:alginate O-acetyltransferase complex protein AlgI
MILSLPFFLTLLVSASVYWLIPKQAIRTLFLTLVSLLFLTWIDWHVTVLILGLTIFTFPFSRQIERNNNKKIWLSTGIIGLLAALVFFKYLGLLENTWNDLHSFLRWLPVFRIELLFMPLGISYIIFKYISFLIDVYWGIVRRSTFIEFLCYGSLYTIYVAGPIERFERLKPQFENKKTFTPDFLSEGFERIVFGIFKKAVLADWIGYFINPVLQHPNDHSLILRIAALLGFSFQIYFDFSGYSDIAIGSSRFFGLKIMENFNWPYLQPNISQFWRCWHISLSEWIRDYIFFPLSRISRNRVWNILFVPVIAMGLCGFWHGPKWHFLIWGMIHGLAISSLQVWNLIKKKNPRIAGLAKAGWFNLFSILLTFAFVTIAWIWFM